MERKVPLGVETVPDSTVQQCSLMGLMNVRKNGGRNFYERVKKRGRFQKNSELGQTWTLCFEPASTRPLYNGIAAGLCLFFLYDSGFFYKMSSN